MTDNILSTAIQTCTESKIAFCKFITANDTGATGGHQAGFHINKNAWRLFFDTPGEKGKNKDIFVKIRWQNDFETESRFIYYGVGTRNEYRLTRFGRGFPFLHENNIGDLLILAKKDDKLYDGFVLSGDLEIEEFFSSFGITSTETNGILPRTTEISVEEKFHQLFEKFISTLKVDFPTTSILAQGARNIFFEAFHLSKDVVLEKPDRHILNWISTEYDLFKAIENNRYKSIIKTPFPSVDALINIANTILNRRKSRAGKSLEHHLAEVFNIWELSYASQPQTEDKKKPDFIFPDIKSYYKEPKGSNKLIFLGAKTTCKDRWRQIIAEADKIPQKHLFTLQQGISKNQLKEMKSSGVTLVVPKDYLSSFPVENRNEIWTLEKFLKYVKSTQV
ncbi:type II restriction endonuclease [Anaerophaga thermohalophila]|uniref:type II restriction endonuclease n=1 Tax=Anaerophaga thermohalophila TaxID=177400 RepID=UPI00030C1556|nr:type II restriction endonuclease [Anaerophaga thermohalophila]